METDGFEEIFLYWVFFLKLEKNPCISFSKALENSRSNYVVSLSWNLRYFSCYKVSQRYAVNF